MKKTIIKILFMLFVISFSCALLASCTDGNNKVAYSQSYIVLSFNPELEIVSDEKGEITALYPINTDAEALLNEFDFVGLNVEKSIDMIIERAYSQGFITEETQNVVLDVTSEDRQDGFQIRQRIADKIRQRFEKRGMECNITEADVSQYSEQAQGIGRTLVETKMINRILEIDPLQDIENLKGKPIGELARLFASLVNDKAVCVELREEYKKERMAIIEQKEGFIILREEIEALKEEIANFEGTEEEKKVKEEILAAKEKELENLKNELSAQFKQVREQYQNRMREIKQHRKNILAQRKINRIRNKK